MKMAFEQYILLFQQLVPNPWMQALVLIIATVILSKITQVVIEKVVIHITKKTKTDVDDKIIEQTKNPLFFLVLFIGFRLALEPLGINSIVEKVVESVAAFFFIYILGSVITISIDSWGHVLAKKTRTPVDETLIPLLQKTVKVLFFIIAVLWVLHIGEIDITPYLAGLGLGGLVLGLALQDSLKNIFGGISIILDRNFNIGDKVKLESGELGEILDIGLRSTKLQTYDQEVIFIPNGQLANMRIQNYVRPTRKVRVVVNFGVEYGSDVDKVKKVVNAALKSMKDVSDIPYMDAVFTEMGEFAMLFQARFFVDDYKISYDKKIEATQKIYEALNKAKIGIPFPTRTVYMKKA